MIREGGAAGGGVRGVSKRRDASARQPPVATRVGKGQRFYCLSGVYRSTWILVILHLPNRSRPVTCPAQNETRTSGHGLRNTRPDISPRTTRHSSEQMRVPRRQTPCALPISHGPHRRHSSWPSPPSSISSSLEDSVSTRNPLWSTASSSSLLSSSSS